MSVKLIVHKIESGANLQYLCVTINDHDENHGFETNFSNWYEGQWQISQKDIEKSRLVVKIVTENVCGANFDLDSCAQEHVSAITPTKNIHAYPEAKDYIIKGYYDVMDDHNNQAIYGDCKSNGSDIITPPAADISTNLYLNPVDLTTEKKSLVIEPPKKSARNHFYKTNTQSTTKSNYANDQVMSPLEYSLEKVKKNNARIMENIQMLNRTLNYTKKNEILNIACSKSLRSYPCTICGKCFVYETGLKRHYSLRHSLTEIQPRWQIVWTCIECFQVWPRHDFALRHASQCTKSGNTDCVREIKTSSLLQCEFCEKVFTSIPRLLRHSKLHTTASNYECNACESNFWSYKSAEQHWAVCPWQTICYKFSLPKLLLCNACDRKFRTYEQLYNHRYKVGHYTTKTYNDPAKAVMSFVYQCELCGQSFSLIPTLLVHRTHYHPHYDNAPQIQMVRKAVKMTHAVHAHMKWSQCPCGKKNEKPGDYRHATKRISATKKTSMEPQASKRKANE